MPGEHGALSGTGDELAQVGELGVPGIAHHDDLGIAAVGLVAQPAHLGLAGGLEGGLQVLGYLLVVVGRGGGRGRDGKGDREPPGQCGGEAAVQETREDSVGAHGEAFLW